MTTVFGTKLASEPVKFQCLNFYPLLNSTLSKSREDRGPGLPKSEESSLEKIIVHSKHCAIQQYKISPAVKEEKNNTHQRTNEILQIIAMKES